MISKGLLIEQLKRFWMISFLFSLTFIIAGIVIVLGRGYDFAPMQGVVEILSMEDNLILIISLALPLTVASFTFGVFFNRKASITIYALPLTKSQIGITNALAGIILCMIPIVIASLLLLIPIEYNLEPYVSGWGWMRLLENEAIFPNAIAHGDVINTIPVVARFFARMTIIVLFYFALSWLAFSLSGNFVIGLLTGLFFNLLPAALVFLAVIIGEIYVFGFHAFNVLDRSMIVFIHSNPVLWRYMMENHNRFETIMNPYLLFSGLTMVMFIVAFTISRLRKLERTGDSIIFTPVKHALIFLVSLCFMILFGGFLHMYDQPPLVFHIGLILGFGLGFVISQMIAEKSFHMIRKLKSFPYFAGLAVALYGITLFVTQVGMGAYINYIPPRSDIVGVSIDNWMPWHTTFDTTYHQHLFVSNPDIIDLTVQAHEKILDERNYLNITPLRQSNVSQRRHRHIAYLLECGRIVTRMYLISDTFAERTGFNDIVYNREMIVAGQLIFSHPELVTEISFYHMPEGYWDDDIWRGRVGSITYVNDPTQLEVLMHFFADIFVEQRQPAFFTMKPDPHFRPESVNVSFIVDLDRLPTGTFGFMSGFTIDGEHLESLQDILTAFGFPNFTVEE
ncbi:MAG: hypothetical protein FWE05_03280 [Defluviitaleaceae bacterium]|nr:hypothetical protein [Defluviitaleaceae bacterium]